MDAPHAASHHSLNVSVTTGTWQRIGRAYAHHFSGSGNAFLKVVRA